MSHFITTSPSSSPCHRCGRLQLTGLDEGLPYRVDPAPLTLPAELAARLTNRRTYALIARTLAYRSAGRISMDRHRGRPPVLADHRCEHPPAAADIAPEHAAAIAKLIAATETAPEPDTDALFRIAHALNGRVVAVIDEPAPF